MSLWILLSLLTYLSSTEPYNFDSFEDFCFDVESGKCDTNFVAFLFHPKRPKLLCLGALITDYWVVDNCVDEPGFAYKSIRLGGLALRNWSITDTTIHIYNIAQRVTHKQYYRLNFRIKGDKNKYVYAANNTISLHKTETRVIMIPHVIRTIDLYPKTYTPEKGDVISIGQLKLERLRLPAIARRTCDKHFEGYFTKDENILINERQICFKTAGITPDTCCHSHGLLLYDGKLAGIMGWSTTCSKSIGVDPWIFTLLIFYRQFIRNETNLEYYIAMQNMDRKKIIK